MVSGLLSQLQIFWPLYLIELLGHLIGLELFKLQNLIYPRLSTGFGMLAFFRKQVLLNFRLGIWPYSHLLSVLNSFEWFWKDSVCKNNWLMLEEFLEVLFLTLHFSYHTLMAFLIMLSVTLLSMLMIHDAFQIDLLPELGLLHCHDC